MDIDKLMMYCRFSKRYSGYHAMKECLKIVMEDEKKLLYITGLYYEVGLRVHATPGGVERNLRTLVNSSWKYYGREPMEILFGAKLEKNLSVGETIELLVSYLNGDRHIDLDKLL